MAGAGDAGGGDRPALVTDDAITAEQLLDIARGAREAAGRARRRQPVNDDPFAWSPAPSPKMADAHCGGAVAAGVDSGTATEEPAEVDRLKAALADAVADAEAARNDAAALRLQVAAMERARGLWRHCSVPVGLVDQPEEAAAGVASVGAGGRRMAAHDRGGAVLIGDVTVPESAWLAPSALTRDAGGGLGEFAIAVYPDQFLAERHTAAEREAAAAAGAAPPCLLLRIAVPRAPPAPPPAPPPLTVTPPPGAPRSPPGVVIEVPPLPQKPDLQVQVPEELASSSSSSSSSTPKREEVPREASPPPEPPPAAAEDPPEAPPVDSWDPERDALDLAKINDPEMFRAPFRVQKYNPDAKVMKGGKPRIWVLDFFKQGGKFINTVPGKNATETLALADSGRETKDFKRDKLYRVERDVDDALRARVTFFGAEHPYDLVFDSAAERQSFYTLAKALRGNTLWAPSLCPPEAAAPGREVFPTKVRGKRECGIKDGDKGERQRLNGELTLHLARNPTQQVWIRVATIDLDGREMSRKADLGRWLPRGGGSDDFHVVSFQGIAKSQVGKPDLGDAVTHHLGREYVQLLTTEKEGKRSVNIAVWATKKWALRVVNTGAWLGKFSAYHRDGTVGGLAPGKADKDKTEAAAVCFSIQDSSLCFFSTKINVEKLASKKDAEDARERNAVLADLLARVDMGRSGVDLASRFQHVFIFGGLGYGWGHPKPPTEWPGWSSMLPEGSDRLAAEMRKKRALAGFQEADMELEPAQRPPKPEALAQRVLWRSWPGLQLGAEAYQAHAVRGVGPGACGRYRLSAELPSLAHFSDPPLPRVTMRIQRCTLEVDPPPPATTPTTPKRSMTGTSMQSAGRKKSFMGVGGKERAPAVCTVAGKELAAPYVAHFADWAEGAYRGGVLAPDPDTGLIQADDFAPMFASTKGGKEWLDRQHLTITIKDRKRRGDAGSDSPSGGGASSANMLGAASGATGADGGSQNLRTLSVSPTNRRGSAIGRSMSKIGSFANPSFMSPANTAAGLATADDRRIPAIVSGVLSLRGIIPDKHAMGGSGTHAFRVPLDAAGAPAGATLTGMLCYDVDPPEPAPAPR